MEFYGLFVFSAFLLLILALIPYIFFCLTLRKALELAGPENRTMSPDMVWLNLIPFFNCIWHFVIVSKIGQAVVKKHEKLGKPLGDKGSTALGIGMSVSFVIGMFFNAAVFLLFVILWIVYWVKIGKYNESMRMPEQVAEA